MLELSVDGHLRGLAKKAGFYEKSLCFYLKVPLFVEKRQNKFAYELKKNKFVFN
jgi:hypothetical protein